MIHLCLDTCTWIYLANGFEPGKLIGYLNEEIEKGNIRIILPELVIKEWMNISTKSINAEIERNFKESLEGLKKIQYLIEDDSTYTDFIFIDDEEEALKKVFKTFESKKDFFKNKAQQNANEIERIFHHPSTIKIKYSQENINTATSFALEKQSPFGTKNGMSDALIFLQLIEYLKSNQILGAYFITWNQNDFARKNKKQLDPNLDLLLNSVGGRFYSALAYAIHSIKGDILSAEELKTIERKKTQIEDRRLDEDYACIVCENNKDRFSPLSFHDSYPIVDERKPFDPNQLALFKFEANPSPYSDNALKGACCDYCGTVHVKCPDCYELMEFSDSYSFNQIENCTSCGLRFMFRNTKDRKGAIDIQEFAILPPSQQCSGCPNEFEPRGDNSDLCQACEDKYGYGD